MRLHHLQKGFFEPPLSPLLDDSAFPAGEMAGLLRLPKAVCKLVTSFLRMLMHFAEPLLPLPVFFQPTELISPDPDSDPVFPSPISTSKSFSLQLVLGYVEFLNLTRLGLE